VAYQVTDAGDASHRLPLPDADCDTTACSAAQLATFDLWQWESLLLGESEKVSGIYAGGLISPRACITGTAGEIAVTISWLDAATSKLATAAVCDGDEVASDVAAGDAAGNTLRRHQLTVATFIEPR
jgi:type IV pilus assembly protein PilV